MSSIMILTLISPIFGDESQQHVINLRNLEDTITFTDLDIARVKKEVTIKKYDRDQVIDEQDEASDTILEHRLKQEEYYADQAEKDLEYEKWRLAETTRDVVIAGKENYFNYILNLDAIELKKSQIERLNKELDAVELKISLGTDVQSSKLTKELEISQAEYDLVELEFDLQSRAFDLNNSLMWDLETTIDVFRMDIPTVTYDIGDMEAAIEEVLEYNGELVKLEEELELAELYLEVLEDEDYDEEDDEFVDAQDDIDAIKLDIRDVKRSLEYDIRSGYNAMLNTRDKVSIEALEIENLEYSLEIVKKRFEVGLDVIASVRVAEEAVAYAEHDWRQARLDYYIESEKLRNLVEIVEE